MTMRAFMQEDFHSRLVVVEQHTELGHVRLDFLFNRLDLVRPDASILYIEPNNAALTLMSKTTYFKAGWASDYAKSQRARRSPKARPSMTSSMTG